MCSALMQDDSQACYKDFQAAESSILVLKKIDKP